MNLKKPEKNLIAAAKRWYRMREEHGWLRPDTTGMNCRFCRKEFRKLVKAIEGTMNGNKESRSKDS